MSALPSAPAVHAYLPRILLLFCPPTQYLSENARHTVPDIRHCQSDKPPPFSDGCQTVFCLVPPKAEGLFPRQRNKYLPQAKKYRKGKSLHLPKTPETLHAAENPTHGYQTLQQFPSCRPTLHNNPHTCHYMQESFALLGEVQNNTPYLPRYEIPTNRLLNHSRLYPILHFPAFRQLPLLHRQTKACWFLYFAAPALHHKSRHYSLPPARVFF